MTQRLYEGMFLFDAALSTKDWPGLESLVHDILKKNSAELVYSERWPDRKLAFEIKGCKRGTYYLTYFNAPPSAVQGVQRDCQLSERILRLLVLYDESLVTDCQKRISREVQGSPEEIEERRERGKLGLLERLSPAVAPAEIEAVEVAAPRSLVLAEEEVEEEPDETFDDAFSEKDADTK